jgi:uncharacterized LabA/DUF88 family protein
VDGFNLFYGLKCAGLRDSYWLDVVELARKLAGPEELRGVSYFTSRVRREPAEAERQSVYLDALIDHDRARGTPFLSVHYGTFMRTTEKCRDCSSKRDHFREKQSDVNLATELLTDGVRDLFDVAWLISGDADLTTPVRRVRELWPAKRVFVAFPPRRASKALRDAADRSVNLTAEILRHSLLPERVVTPRGATLERPPRWRGDPP